MWQMNGAHMIDRTCWVLDTDVEAVKAYVGNPFHGIAADDANVAFLQLRNGQTATIMHAGWTTKGVDKCEVEVVCTNGMLKFDSYSNWIQIDRDGKYAPVDVERHDPFTMEMRNLVGAIQGKERLAVSPAWGRHIVDVLNACEESSRTGREMRIQSRGIEAPVAR
jgi:predicted dehydrogenase